MIVAGLGCTKAATWHSFAGFLPLLETTEIIAVPEWRLGQLQALEIVSHDRLTSLSAQDIAGIKTLTISPAIQEKYETGSVCEALALVAAGPHGLLKGPRIVSPDRQATLAIAQK